MSTQATTKIINVEDQEFSVAIETDNEAIRQHLTATFPNVASATIKEGTKTVDGVTYPVVEFVKHAGRKGLSGAELAHLLRRVPAAWNTVKTSQSVRLADLLNGTLSLAQVVAHADDLDTQIRIIEAARFHAHHAPNTVFGVEHRLMAIPALAGGHEAWW